jgi:hypothetical protein
MARFRSFAVLRRCTASLALLSVALIAGMRPAPAFAASIVSEKVINGVDQIVPDGTAGSTMYAYYQLTNTRSTTVNDLIVTSIVPPNTVQPINASTSPLSIVNGSFGFDQSNLQVFLSPADPTTQGLALQFANGGLAPGGTLNFKVSLDPSVTSMTAPTLVLQPPDADLSVTAPNLLSYTPVSANAAPFVGGNTPEPVSLVLWSALAGVGLLRARSFRRSRLSASKLN